MLRGRAYISPSYKKPKENIMLDLIRDMIHLPGLSGYELPVREFIVDRLKGLAAFMVHPTGNLTTTIGTGSPRILFSSHMDEIGMVVSYIEENGFLRIRKVGMLDDRLLIGRSVEVISEPGKIPGVIGIRPPHLMTSLDEFEKRRDVPTWDDILIDVGTSSRNETESLGIKIMDPIVFSKEFKILNDNKWVARSLDDRFGCALLMKSLEAVAKSDLDREVSFAWTVQEEIGALGAQALSKEDAWDIMFAVNAYSSADVPGVPMHYGPAVLGNGPVLRMMDHHSLSTPALARCTMGHRPCPERENTPPGRTNGGIYRWETFRIHGNSHGHAFHSGSLYALPC